MKAKTARPLLLVMLFGFLASNGWMITEYGPGSAASGYAPASAAIRPPANAQHQAAAAQPPAPLLASTAGAAGAPRTGAKHPSRAAAAPADGQSAASAPMLAASTLVNPEASLPDDPAADLVFPGATNWASGTQGLSAAPPADPPLVGARPGSGSAAPPVSGGAAHSHELAEPGSWALLAAGLMALGLWRRRMRAA